MKRPSILSPLLSAAGLLPAAVLAAVLLFPQSAAADPASAKLTLTVTDIKDHKGVLMVGVFDQSGYDTDQQVTGMMIPVTGDTATASVDIPAGTYGLKLFHDVDGDGKMGANPFGMPTEPFAFSNNAMGRFGPAKWDDARFEVTADGAVQVISLN
jgi:uncharacterized protein (DUF2141 family)